jgi:hypothetical protein
LIWKRKTFSRHSGARPERTELLDRKGAASVKRPLIEVTD